MLKDGIINGQLASLLARFRHVNSIAVVDGPFPTYRDVETVDLAVSLGFPKIPDILKLILPRLHVTSYFLADEFYSKVETRIVDSYLTVLKDIQQVKIPHEDFKLKVGKTLGIIHTGDDVPYSSVILNSG
jgi:D-ribose pyranase